MSTEREMQAHNTTLVIYTTKKQYEEPWNYSKKENYN